MSKAEQELIAKCHRKREEVMATKLTDRENDIWLHGYHTAEDRWLSALSNAKQEVERLTMLIKRIVEAVNCLPSVTGLSPIKDVNDIPLAIRDLQECYKDAARARNVKTSQ